jgi:D-alanine-D-alanine ligase-like ATP-grasp enzyme
MCPEGLCDGIVTATTRFANLFPSGAQRNGKTPRLCYRSARQRMNDRFDPPSGQPTAPPRAAVKLLRAAASALNIRVETFCGDWVARLIAPGGQTRLVWGYNFDLNPAAGARVASDKAATFEVLRAAGVPAVEHRLFLRADMDDYVSEAGNWKLMLRALEESGGDAVIKPAEGSGGSGVTRVRSPRQLEQAVGALWPRTHAICISPFMEIEREVRFILLDGEPRIVYEKQIDALVGDGHRCVGELILARLREDPHRWTRNLTAAVARFGGAGWDQVLRAGERLPLAWKHNLRGARAAMIESPQPALLSLARSAAAALGLRLCAVDVIQPNTPAEPLVLEVNCGLMLERYVEQAPDGWRQGLELTRDVIQRMFTT